MAASCRGGRGARPLSSQERRGGGGVTEKMDSGREEVGLGEVVLGDVAREAAHRLLTDGVLDGRQPPDEATLEAVHDFEGKFGVSSVAILQAAPGKVKTYFNGVERDCLKRFVETVELPAAVQFVRVLKESQKNEGRSFGYLYIKEA